LRRARAIGEAEENPLLGSIRSVLEGQEHRKLSLEWGKGSIDVELYSLDDKDLLWYTPGKYSPRLAVPRSLVSDIIALVHLQTSHQGVGRTVHLTRRYFF
ncbi:unnamed protein product, partial [Choristocarpus tenellus]